MKPPPRHSIWLLYQFVTFIISALSCCVSPIQLVTKNLCKKGQVTAVRREASAGVLTISHFVDQLHGDLSRVRRLPKSLRPTNSLHYVINLNLTKFMNRFHYIQLPKNKFKIFNCLAKFVYQRRLSLLCLPKTKHKIQKFLFLFEDVTFGVSQILQCSHTG